MLYLAEYKRRQAPPGVKISSKNFGRDRRYPIVNKFREGKLAPPRAGAEAAPAQGVSKAKRGERA
jgi:NAD+ synthase